MGRIEAEAQALRRSLEDSARRPAAGAAGVKASSAPSVPASSAAVSSVAAAAAGSDPKRAAQLQAKIKQLEARLKQVQDEKQRQYTALCRYKEAEAQSKRLQEEMLAAKRQRVEVAKRMEEEAKAFK